MILAELATPADPRVLAGTSDNEDAAVLVFPQGKALVQTVDFFTPIVNDPHAFGQIAAANALSDVYAMGGEPFSAMNIVCFPIKTLDHSILKDILKGGLDKIREAGAMLVGGHSVEDDEIKYGLSVTGLVDAASFARNRNLAPGDQLLLTKPLGTGVLATAIKANWAGSNAFETILTTWASRLNRTGAHVIRTLSLRAATDVTGFGLGGHLLEMARASNVRVELSASQTPFIPEALELAAMGLIPVGSHANKKFCESSVHIHPSTSQIHVDLIFDAQTSGGLVLAVPPDKLDQARDMLLQAGDLAAHIGQVLPPDSGPRLAIL